MDKYAFKAAKSSFNPEAIDKGNKDLEEKRQEFVGKYTRDRISSMGIDEYVQGKRKESLCYDVEWTLEKLGRIQGSTAIKFGVYYSAKSEKYVFARKFGKSHEEAFDNIKKEIVNLIDAGENKDMKAIISNSLSPMFKGKLLSLYYPDKYLNIFAEAHIDYYISELGCEVRGCSSMDVAEKRDVLLKFKNEDEDMKNWSINAFATFLYSEYPKAPNEFKEKNEDPFEILDNAVFADIDYIMLNKSRNLRNGGETKVTEDKLRREKRIGNRGEAIVLEAEKQWLRDKGINKEIKHVAKTNDTAGYDIESYFEDGSTKYIEVKATKGKIGDVHFYISINEYETALKLRDKYCIYLVLEATSSMPQIIRLGNPFISKIDEKDMTPIKYRVDIKTFKKKK